jgi:hypothetical protein
LPATKYYKRQRRKYAKECRMMFKDFDEVKQAIEFLCRTYDLPYIDVRLRLREGVYSYFRPPHFWRGRVAPHFEFQGHHFDLYTVAHEFAHYIDYEDATRDGRWKTRGHPHKYFRWHSKRFDALVADCIQVLKRRLNA